MQRYFAMISIALMAILSIRLPEVDAVHLPPIYWNSSSHMFIGNADPALTVRLMDTVDVHCPFYNDTLTQDEAEYSIIYSVSKRAYEECFLDGDAQPIVQCRSPFGVESIVKWTFRDYSPLPNAIEYQPGQTYYFISTSDGILAGLNNRNGGLCRRKHMRLKVKVEKREEGTLDDPSAIDHASSAGRTGQLSSARQSNGRDGKEHSDESVDVKFIVDDNKLIQPTLAPSSVDTAKLAESDVRTNSLIYHPFGVELGGGSVKRDHHATESWPRHKWHGMRGREERRNEEDDTPIVMYEIHEMDAQSIRRYPTSSSSSTSICVWTVLLITVLLAITRHSILL